jgi:hypothetical protein
LFLQRLLLFYLISSSLIKFISTGPSGARKAILDWEQFRTPDKKEFEESYYGPTGKGVNGKAIGCKSFFERINAFGFVENETLLQHATELLNRIGGKDSPDVEKRESSLLDRLAELISKLHHAKLNPQHYYISCACCANGSLSYAAGRDVSDSNRTKAPHKVLRPKKPPPVCERERCAHAGRIVHCSACDGSTPKWESLLSIQLLTPSVLLAPIAEKCRSLILASGSLAPLGSLCAELGLEPASDDAHRIKPGAKTTKNARLQVKPPPLEANHVINLDKQLRAVSIGCFPDGTPLTITYSNYKHDGAFPATMISFLNSRSLTHRQYIVHACSQAFTVAWGMPWPR